MSHLKYVLLILVLIKSSISIPCSTKKGLVYNGIPAGGTFCYDAAAANAPHFVNFSPVPGACVNVTKMHYPTLYKPADIQPLADYLARLAPHDIPEWVMGFNEPNFAYGVDNRNVLTPDETAIQWKRVIELKHKYHFKLTSPSPTGINTGHGPERFGWYREWFAACKRHGYDCLESIDAFGVHCYAGWGEFVDVPRRLMEEFHKPTFYSEICYGQNAGLQKQIDFMTRIYTEGEKMKDIVKIFWNTAEPIPGDGNVLGAEIFTRHQGGQHDGKIGSLTKLGELFKSIKNC